MNATYVSPTTLPPGHRPDVVLHIGTGKTGTSSIQAWLHRNRDRLADLGVLFPESPGKRRHVQLGLAMQPDDARRSLDWRTQQVSSPSELRPVFEERLRAEILAARPSRLLLSDEALSGAPDGAIRNLRDFLDGIAGSVRVVVYLRRQDDHLCSRYQQVVKSAECGGWPSAGPDGTVRPLRLPRQARATWRTLMRPDELVVRRFERASLRAARSTRTSSRQPASTSGRRTSRRAEPQREPGCRVGRAPPAAQPPPARPRRRDRRMPPHNRSSARLGRATARAHPEPPRGPAGPFMAQWEASNRPWPATTSATPDGPLREPAQVRNTTTEQRLDPDAGRPLPRAARASPERTSRCGGSRSARPRARAEPA